MPLQNCFVFARSKQLIFNMTYIFNATKSQLRKEVIKIASLFKLHVNNTCSAAHNKINKIHFLRAEEFFPINSQWEKILTCYFVLKI